MRLREVVTVYSMGVFYVSHRHDIHTATATSSITDAQVIQPVVEPQAPADGHTGVDRLAASWEAIAKLDPALVEAMQAMTTRYVLRKSKLHYVEIS